MFTTRTLRITAVDAMTEPGTDNVLVSGGAILKVDAGMFVGGGGNVIVSGGGSFLLAPREDPLASSYAVGLYNDGSALTIRDQGAAILESLGIGISQATAPGGANGTATVTVTGTNSSMLVAKAIDVGGGNLSNPGKFVVESGGHVVSASGSIGRSQQGSGSAGAGSAFVRGEGSQWTIETELRVGPLSAGQLFQEVDRNANLTLSDNGVLKAQVVYLGDTAITSQNVVLRAAINIGGAPGQPQAPGLLDIGDDINMGRFGAIVFNHDATAYDFGTKLESIAFQDGLIEQRAGTTQLTGRLDRFTGDVQVFGGSLFVNTQIGATEATVHAGGRLGGTGDVAGTIAVENGGTLAGGQGDPPLAMQTLVLNAGANVNVGILGATEPVPIFSVRGDLTLDGTLNIDAPLDLRTGLYRLIDYGRTLTDNGLDIGMTPGGLDPANFSVFLGAPGQVNLIYGADTATGGGQPRIGDGGGTVLIGGGGWSDTGGSPATLAQGDFAIVTGAGGALSVDDTGGEIALGGIQFAKSGYSLSGDPIVTSAPFLPLRVGDGSEAGGAFTAIISAPLTGEGGIEKTDLGTLTLTGANDYTGGTRVTAGTLIVDAHSLPGDATIAPDARLAFEQVDAGSFAGIIDGAGTLAKTGAGALALTGDSRAFAGTVDVLQGMLRVNGALGGALWIGSGATLGGTGLLGDVTVRSGGIVAPGNSIGTLRVAGDYVQAAGSTYRVEIDPAGQSDLIDVAGAATIEGGTVFVEKAAGVYLPNTRFTILTAAGGVTGTYDNLDQDMPFVNLALAYDAGAVYLDVLRNSVSFCDVAATANQCSTGRGVESIAGGTLYDAVVSLPDDAAARGAFAALSGEIYASARGAMRVDTRLPRQAVLLRLATASEGNGAWGQLFGNWGASDGNGNATGADRDTTGILAGVDLAAGPNWRFGFAAGYTRTRLALDGRASSGDIDGIHVLGYAGAAYGPVRIRAGIGYADLDLSARRAIAFAGFADSAHGKVNGSALQGFAELGYALPIGGGEIEPFAGFAAVRLSTRAFVERGGSAHLSGARERDTSRYSSLGLRGRVDTGGLALDGALAWHHGFGDITPAATLAFEGGTPFALAGAPLNRDEAAIEAGATLRLAPRLTLGARYQGSIGRRGQDHAAEGVMTLLF